MNSSKKMHFEVSERKVLLRIFDVLFILFGLFCLGFIPGFNYFQFSLTNYYWIIVLTIYINVFGGIFEMYNLQVASSHFQALRSTILTTTSTVICYLLTPVFSPQLPQSRIQLFLFYVVFFISLYAWRMIYVRFLASNRFVQNVILVCDSEQVEELVLGLEQVDPHYRIIGYIHLDTNATPEVEYQRIEHVDIKDLTLFVSKNN